MNLSEFFLKRDQIWVLIAKDIRKYCTRVVKLDHAQIVADGPTAEVLG